MECGASVRHVDCIRISRRSLLHRFCDLYKLFTDNNIARCMLVQLAIFLLATFLLVVVTGKAAINDFANRKTLL
jgi:hypothetical protein